MKSKKWLARSALVAFLMLSFCGFTIFSSSGVAQKIRRSSFYKDYALPILAHFFSADSEYLAQAVATFDKTEGSIRMRANPEYLPEEAFEGDNIPNRTMVISGSDSKAQIRYLSANTLIELEADSSILIEELKVTDIRSLVLKDQIRLRVLKGTVKVKKLSGDEAVPVKEGTEVPEFQVQLAGSQPQSVSFQESEVQAFTSDNNQSTEELLSDKFENIVANTEKKKPLAESVVASNPPPAPAPEANSFSEDESSDNSLTDELLRKRAKKEKSVLRDAESALQKPESPPEPTYAMEEVQTTDSFREIANTPTVEEPKVETEKALPQDPANPVIDTQAVVEEQMLSQADLTLPEARDPTVDPAPAPSESAESAPTRSDMPLSPVLSETPPEVENLGPVKRELYFGLQLSTVALSGKDKINGGTATFSSYIAPGAALTYTEHLNDKYSLNAALEFQSYRFQAVDSRALEKANRLFSSYSLGGTRKFEDHKAILGAYLKYEQVPIPEGTTRNALVIGAPSLLSLGAQYKFYFWERGESKYYILPEAFFSLPATANGYKINLGYGASLGGGWEKPLSSKYLMRTQVALKMQKIETNFVSKNFTEFNIHFGLAWQGR